MMSLLYAFISWLYHTLIHPYPQLSNLPPSLASKHTGGSVAIVAWHGLHNVPAMWGPDTLSHPGFFLLPPQLSNLPSSPASERTGESVAVVARQGLHDVPAMWGPRGDLAIALDAMDKLWPPVLQGKGVPVVLVQFFQHPGLKEHS